MSSNAIEGPRRATRGDFPGILDLVDRCFGHPPGGMAAEWCHVYDATQPERHGVILDDGRVVSHVSIVEDALVVGDGVLPCWGITGVATDPRYRGRGHMSALLDFWIDRMDAEEIPLAKLGGDRRRYGQWGWERAGRERQFRVTPRSLDATPGDEVVVERFEGADEALTRIEAMHETKRYRVRRDRERWQARLDRVQFETIFTAEAGIDAYLAFSRTRRARNTAVISEVTGDVRGIRALFGHVFDAYDVNALQVNVHPTDPLNEFLASPDVSGSWQTKANRSIRIHHLAGMLAVYEREIEARVRAADLPPSRIVLGVAEDEMSAEIDWDGDRVAVESTHAAPDLTLDRMAMTRLLFWDASTVAGYHGHPLLDAVVPLDYYVPLLDRV